MLVTPFLLKIELSQSIKDYSVLLPIHKERLTKLANFLFNVQPHKFSLDAFTDIRGYDPDGLKSLHEYVDDALDDNDCGTTACGVGYMPKVFPADFYWDEDNNVRPVNDKFLLEAKANFKHPDDKNYVLDDDTSYFATKYFFGLTEFQWKDLFLRGSYPNESLTTPQEVAERILNRLNWS